MLRTTLGLGAVLFLCAGVALTAEDKKADTKAKDTKNAKAEKHAPATITKVDAKKGTVAVKMKDKEGKEVERTFKLTGDLRMLDSTGKFVVIDFFRSGDEVLVLEEKGELKEMRKPDAKAKEKAPEKTPASKK